MELLRKLFDEIRRNTVYDPHQWIWYDGIMYWKK